MQVADAGRDRRGVSRARQWTARCRSRFTRKTVDGDVFAQAFVSKTVDGVMVGRVFGTKTVNGDLAVGEAALFTGKSAFSDKTLEPVTFSGKLDDHRSRALSAARSRSGSRRCSGARR